MAIDPNGIPKMLRESDGFNQWFAEVMSVFKLYGDKRAELALLSGSPIFNCVTVENYEKCSDAMMDAGMVVADLRDLIGGTVTW